ncbi:MAG: anthranilate synthase component I family protein [Planctomycetaceae bacterium]|nr:anthranilate synthase component I family protein [Planctomycetaceae bacterium]
MDTSPGEMAARVTVRPIDLTCPAGAVVPLLQGQPGAVMLDSSALHDQYGRYSVITCRPIEVLTLDRGALRRDGREIAPARRSDFWPALRAALGRVKLTAPAPPAAYLGGWFGFAGYELANLVERLPAPRAGDTHLPDLRLSLHDAVLVYDALLRQWQMVELVFDHPPDGAGCAARALQDMIDQARDLPTAPPPEAAERADPTCRPVVAGAVCNFTDEQYRQAVARCVEYIAAGDIFQVNLSRRLSVRQGPPAAAIYQALRRRNPAWYSAYLQFEFAGAPCAVLSSSPELFLSARDGRVVTRPIKGTRPRRGDAAADAAAAEALLASPKDNAELAMIIDLLRNDLGRVCRYGSVVVSEKRRLEVHPTVLHLVGTVEGQLCAGVDAAALLRATFPGGSITGAPKIRAMEIINEIESVPRGVYTGCIGYVGVDGSCQWNIAIRTLVCDGGDVHMQVGGGIVADSQPQGELDETADKARAMLEAIEEARVACATAL